MLEATRGRRAATYARVSSRTQADDPRNTSLAEQHRRCREAAEEIGATVVAELVDDGVSGKTLARPAMCDLLAFVDAGQVDVVVATKPDRVSRSLSDLASLVSRLDGAGVELVLLDSPVDLSTPQGRAMLQMQGVFAELERSLITTRMGEGLTAAAEAGRWPGGRAPFGYRLEERRDGTFAVHNPTQVDVVRRMCTMLASGSSTGDVARAFNDDDLCTASGIAWTSSNVRQIVRRNLATWAGTFTFRADSETYEPLEVSVPSIISEADREAVEAALDSYSIRRDTVRTYLLSGRIVSPHGAVMHGHPHKGIRRYRCSHRTVSQRPPGAEQCDCLVIHADTVELGVWDHITALLSDGDRLEELARYQEASAADIQQTQADVIANLDEQVVDAERQLADAFAEVTQAGMSPRAATAATKVYADRLDQLVADRNDAARMRRAGLRAAASASAIAQAADLARQGLTDADPELVQQVFDALDVEVQITGWTTCKVCEGSGVRGAQEGRGTRRCPGCQAMRALPDLIITGIVPEALVLDRGGAEVTPLHPPRAVPFREAG